MIDHDTLLVYTLLLHCCLVFFPNIPSLRAEWIVALLANIVGRMVESDSLYINTYKQAL
jgi:hypothetical protein